VARGFSEYKRQWEKLHDATSKLLDLSLASELQTSDPQRDISATSLSSWSIVDVVDRNALEVESVASCNGQSDLMLVSLGRSSLLFAHLSFQVCIVEELEDQTSVREVLGKDLQQGSKVVAADNVTMLQVSRIELQKATKFIQLEIDGAMPFTTTPNHRIMVPGITPTTVKASELKLNSFVMCSHDMAKPVVGLRALQVSEADVLAITFLPDEPVACYFPVVLTEGMTPKLPRRSGMGERIAKAEAAEWQTADSYR